MSSAGSNGVLDGRVNAQSFLDWQKSVNDFKPFIYQGVGAKRRGLVGFAICFKLSR